MSTEKKGGKVNNEKPGGSSSHPRKKRFECPSCGKGFSSNFALMQHCRDKQTCRERIGNGHFSESHKLGERSRAIIGRGKKKKPKSRFEEPSDSQPRPQLSGNAQNKVPPRTKKKKKQKKCPPDNDTTNKATKKLSKKKGGQKCVKEPEFIVQDNLRDMCISNATSELKFAYFELKAPKKKGRSKSKPPNSAKRLFGVWIPQINFFLHYPLYEEKKGGAPPVPYHERRDPWRSGEGRAIKLARARSGSKRGQRKELRNDRTWDDFAMEPPLILTKHAKERLSERGACTHPRFVPGTHRTIVATFIPAKSQSSVEGRKRRERYLNIRRGRLSHKSYLSSPWKFKAYKAAVRRRRKIKRDAGIRKKRWEKIRLRTGGTSFLPRSKKGLHQEQAGRHLQKLSSNARCIVDRTALTPKVSGCSHGDVPGAPSKATLEQQLIELVRASEMRHIPLAMVKARYRSRYRATLDFSSVGHDSLDTFLVTSSFLEVRRVLGQPSLCLTKVLDQAIATSVIRQKNRTREPPMSCDSVELGTAAAADVKQKPGDKTPELEEFGRPTAQISGGDNSVSEFKLDLLGSVRSVCRER